MQNTRPMPLKGAIREIAETNAGLRLATSITPSDCVEYAADPDVIAAFWAYQRATGDACEHLCSIISDLDPFQGEDALIHSSIAADHAIDVAALRRATITHIAHWLAREATEYQDMEVAA